MTVYYRTKPIKPSTFLHPMKIDNLKALYHSKLTPTNYHKYAKTLVQLNDPSLTNKLLRLASIDTDGNRANAVLTEIFEGIDAFDEIEWQFLGSVSVSERNFF
ncbi:hypothetical protein THOM_0865 [Trachipleistophora hominis]|uniref:Uncharacterized protein n=1 Tax=Trachipleistophora hominis TaxID=72359 RepID=L7JXJ8_TRAHO|nr:hypothetical protein THOM_0865 [Trachipleistophora hominis]